MSHQNETINENQPAFTQLMDLAAERLGGKVLYSTDDFFAEKENLIKPGRGIFIPDKYTENGKWMDGWESRRKRTAGHDWCIVQLATEGKIAGFDIDTNHFLGNHPPHASIEACYLDPNQTVSDWANNDIEWTTILEKSPLDPGSQHFYESQNQSVFNHLRLNIFPDGGVARLKVYGNVHKKWEENNTDLIDLAAAINGGLPLQCSDMFFSNMRNLIMPGRGVNMGDGWETKRSRTPNHLDWVVLKLAKPGKIQKALVDTAHFKGNYPDSCAIEACMVENDEAALDPNQAWENILPQTKLEADKEHHYDISSDKTVSHVRLKMFPDGGISRLRLFGN